MSNASRLNFASAIEPEPPCLRWPFLKVLDLVLAACPVTPGTYTVRSGDTLSAIATSCGTTSQCLQTANSISNPNTIIVGQTLKVPSSCATGGAPAPAPKTGKQLEIPPSFVPALSAAAYAKIQKLLMYKDNLCKLLQAAAWVFCMAIQNGWKAKTLEQSWPSACD